MITGFDPRFNNSRKLWFERPFELLRGNRDALTPFTATDDIDWVDPPTGRSRDPTPQDAAGGAE